MKQNLLARNLQAPEPYLRGSRRVVGRVLSPANFLAPAASLPLQEGYWRLATATGHWSVKRSGLRSRPHLQGQLAPASVSALVTCLCRSADSAYRPLALHF